MNILNKISFLLAILFLVSCKDPGVNNNVNTTPSDTVSTSPVVENDSTNQKSQNSTKTTIPEQKDCEIKDMHLEKNVFVAKDVALQISIVATPATKDKNLGDSHRVLRIVNTVDCSTIIEKTLPIDRSADFPYYLVPKTYDASNQIVAIQGFSSIYFYDIKNKQLAGPVEPQFLTDREAADAQSGMVKGLTIWGHYLFGYAVDFGIFAFDISDPKKPESVLPVAEYLIPNTENYNNLFILDSGNDLSQAIIPSIDMDNGGDIISLKKMFAQALKVNTTVAKNVRNNRFIILNDNTDAGKEKKVVIDMFAKKQIDLPESVAAKKTGEILNWLKSQE